MLLRIAFLLVIALLLFAINLLGMAMTGGQRQAPLPPLLRVFWIGSIPALSWVVLSIPVQYATRRLVRRPVWVAVLAHIVVAACFHIAHGAFLVAVRSAAGQSNPRIPLSDEFVRHAVAALPQNLLVYAAIVAGTLAWDNWRLSVRRERTAAQLAVELTRAELSALRSKMQPHFLFNALHGISSVMETDVAKARQMMVALSNLLRSSLQARSERAAVEQEVQFTRDSLKLQHMRFEERLEYDVQVDARQHLRIPAFVMQPLVENAVIHAMADRSEPTRVGVTVRERTGQVEIEVTDNGPGFPSGIIDGTTPAGVGLGALRARLLALPNGQGMMTLANRPDGGAQVIVRVPVYDEEDSNA